MESDRILPLPTVETLPFWQSLRQGRLSLPRCVGCGELLCPPPPRCPRCLSDRLAWETLSGRGVLQGWTTVHSALSGLRPPFTVAEVELAEQAGLVMVANLTEAPPVNLKAGARVTMDLKSGKRGADGTVFPLFRLDP